MRWYTIDQADKARKIDVWEYDRIVDCEWKKPWHSDKECWCKWAEFDVGEYAWWEVNPTHFMYPPPPPKDQ